MDRRITILVACQWLVACKPAWDPESPMHWASTGNAVLDISLGLIIGLLWVMVDRRG